MTAGVSIVGYVQVCTAQSPTTGECTESAWMPPPTFLPVLTIEDSMWLFVQSVCVLACAWGWKVLGRQIRW